ncbi:MAG: hypothetical protein C0609_03795 [Deltaproteobacteria bacterium]|nr:MAG: hypothetical protein C0609_03795 [Deltaproteobacteria bacterium]
MGGFKPAKRLRWLLGIMALVMLLPPLRVISWLGGRDFAMKYWGKVLLATFGIKVHSSGSIPPKGSLVAFNHVSFFDPIVIGSVYPGSFLSKAEVDSWPFVGFAARIGKTIFIERESLKNSRSALTPIVKNLTSGERVYLFAEGGILGDGVTVELFRPMFFQAAMEAGAPVVPAALIYGGSAARKAWHWEDGSVAEHMRRNLFPEDGEIVVEVAFGDPIAYNPALTRKTLAAMAHHAVSELVRARREGAIHEG